MEKITRKEVFDCALALYASIINTINEESETLYDYALILQKNSTSEIACLKPGEDFSWNKIPYGEKTYAFIPIFVNYIAKSTLAHCGGNDNEYYGCSVSFEKFNAYQHPCPWIKEILAKQYLKLTYWGGTLMSNRLEYDLSFLSKKHSTWICAKVDDLTMYIPYYSQAERDKAFSKLPGYYAKMTQQFWEQI